jgi:hypothetical protein
MTSPANGCTSDQPACPSTSGHQIAMRSETTRCRHGQRSPVNNAQYWNQKRRGNSERDKRNLRHLRRHGWRVLTIWECQTRDINNFAILLAPELANSASTSLGPIDKPFTSIGAILKRITNTPSARSSPPAKLPLIDTRVPATCFSSHCCARSIFSFLHA